MRIAVISDVHGNLQALQAVLADIAAADVDERWCLGDIVGYGADPNDCVRLVAANCAVCLGGNHDCAVTGGIPVEDFSTGAGIAVRWTQKVMAPDTLETLEQLVPTGEARGVSLYHASPRDPVWEYVTTNLLANFCLDLIPTPVGLIGHSHRAIGWVRREGEIATGDQRVAGETVDLAVGHWLLNPGSVGQPRDGRPDASWLLLDLAAGSAQWRRTPYDIAGAQAAIRAARLPDSLAERLRYGQ